MLKTIVRFDGGSFKEAKFTHQEGARDFTTYQKQCMVMLPIESRIINPHRALERATEASKKLGFEMITVDQTEIHSQVTVGQQPPFLLI